MDIFALLFIVSFLALLVTLAVMHIRKGIKTKDNVAKSSKHIGWISDMLGRGDYFMCYRVHDLIGETSHKTDKLTIK